MSRVYQLAPSILSADFNRLGEQDPKGRESRVPVASYRYYGWNVCTIHFVWNAGGKVDPKRKQSVF